MTENEKSAAEADTWNIAEVAAVIGAASTGSARRSLSRWGVRAVGREPGRSGTSLYLREDVRAARASRPGRGHRTDLDPQKPQVAD
ncbi:hypothetical protein ACFV0R_25640 [Streptomyces sp. NPDC059578]|uniref:hypothetical protein n=1 Tax=Streptomyces sp. NPDC059578 TaxID=3346874 RepID=UPI00369107FF